MDLDDGGGPEKETFGRSDEELIAEEEFRWVGLQKRLRCPAGDFSPSVSSNPRDNQEEGEGVLTEEELKLVLGLPAGYWAAVSGGERTGRLLSFVRKNFWVLVSCES